MPLFRARWDIDMGSCRVTPGESVELDQDDPALPALLAAGVLERLPEPPAEGKAGEAASDKPSERAPVPAAAGTGAPAPRRPVRGRARKG